MSTEDIITGQAPALARQNDQLDDIVPAKDEAEIDQKELHTEGSAERRRALMQMYGRKAEADNVAPAGDLDMILDRIMEMSDERAINILLETIDVHEDDPNFPSWTLEKIRLLIQGYKIADMEQADWSFELRAEAAIIYYHSPYPEVRSVTEPFDDPTIPVETIRCYVLGMGLMGVSTAINTFFSPRQPSINLSSLVLQCILAPCGAFLAKVLPDWGFSAFGRRVSLNPGPWSFKEQIFASIMIGIGNSAGATYYTYLVQMLPQYLGQTWVSFGYELLLAIYAQMSGFGFAGIFRRVLIYPPAAIWPKVLPTLALNRTLIQPERRGENINGWTISRYRFFMIAFGLMFVWFWIPNRFFTALHSFNWMTWIAPQNFDLAMVTGFYGGLGFNPWATFDWNVSGSGALVTPFFAEIQSYAGRFVSGIIILIMYYSNYAWASYMPINSNETFDNHGKEYNISKVMGDDGYVNVAAYKEYGPPYYGGANVFGQGNLPAWYMLTLTYVPIRYWSTLKSSFKQVYKSFRRGDRGEEDDDAHTKMMMAYKTVPDWWYLCILAISLACGIGAVAGFPTHTPWWSLLATMAIGWVFLIPASFILAIANTGVGLDILFKILSGVWFPGNPMALLLLESIGPTFDSQSESLMAQQKLGHYAKIPPRALFRGMLISVFINILIFIGVLNWMVSSYNSNGDLCTWSNAEHFVCLLAVQDFTSAVMYGVYGVRNMYTMYPAIPYAMLLGACIGTSCALLQKYGHKIAVHARSQWAPEKYEKWDRYLFKPFGKLYWFNPSIFWSGACTTWTGGGNLSFHTQHMYISFIWMYYIKRHYSAWWEKYNFILEAGLDVGVAVSGTIQTLAFAFSGAEFPKWWGNTVSTAGVDYLAYNQKAARFKIPEKGYFGLEPNQYPLKYPKDLLDGKKGIRPGGK